VLVGVVIQFLDALTERRINPIILALLIGSSDEPEKIIWTVMQQSLKVMLKRSVFKKFPSMEKLLNSLRKELFVYKIATIRNPEQSGADTAKGGLTNSINQSE
jgi:hypothetical protein